FRQGEAALTRRRSGAGLGLYYSKHIVEHHGGRIWVESKEGKGARFVFTLAVDPLVAMEKSK
ncbi:MAG: ATP-binding protein, partial [bacterium]